MPECQVVLVANGSFAGWDVLAQVQTLPHASLITRLRLNAALYDPAPLRQPGQKGRPQLTGKRRPILEVVLADEETSWSQLTIDA